MVMNDKQLVCVLEETRNHDLFWDYHGEPNRTPRQKTRWALIRKEVCRRRDVQERWYIVCGVLFLLLVLSLWVGWC